MGNRGTRRNTHMSAAWWAMEMVPCESQGDSQSPHTHRGILAGHLEKLTFILNIIAEKLLENL